jgi:hypothetical protein
MLDNAADCGDAGSVSSYARKSASRRPATVAVHDDCDVKPGL